MMTRTQAREILAALCTLPPEKVAEVHDFVTFLQERYGQRTAVDVSDAWSEEDLHDLIQASLEHAKRTIWAIEERLHELRSHHRHGSPRRIADPIKDVL
ncbi:MAG: DUF2281 domain-containing protein [Anaerolineae bacterium]|nr:DUF2281 domain-containing protein [Anaerolineae bacterium]